MDYSVFFLPTLLLLLGFLALKLPRKFNPFQLKRSYAQYASESTNGAIPKAIGWVLLGIGAVWWLGIITLFALSTFLNNRSSNGAEEFARQNVIQEHELVDRLNNLIQSADSYSVLSKNGGRYTTSVKKETARLDDLKKAFLLTPRKNLSSAYYIVPNLVVDFHKKGKTIVQIKLSISKDQTSLNAVNVAESKNADSTLGQSATAMLLKVLSEHQEENLQRILKLVTKPEESQARE